ncbi:MAG TPA: [FeFe] hydrogenase H-cluster maturation GTPase HydF [Rectinemataceae bacterium]|nr:[FeFe] hydrogenase H-cluster maturation GTPase HydF [Rectinemataceae bacterium]
MIASGAPNAERVRIVFAGIRNAGKSSLMNRLFQRDVSIVSPEPGTTTDPVSRPIELGKLGPALVVDTAGLDDSGALGLLRVERSRAALEVADIRVLVTPADRPPEPAELRLAEVAAEGAAPLVVALTFDDRARDPRKDAWLSALGAQAIVSADNLTGRGAAELRESLMALADRVRPEPGILDNLVVENELVLLVTPIDLAAPKGRLILPQVEAIREVLDRDCAALVVKERELARFYPLLRERPSLVVTDSQAFSKVAADIPEDQRLTSFSILLARKKGDIRAYLAGVEAIADLPENAKILVIESCSHHRQAEDLGTVKIPRLFRQLVPKAAGFSFSREMPGVEELRSYSLVITCGNCMRTRREVLSQLGRLGEAGVPVTNYGVFLAWANGLLPRAVELFPELAELRTAR